MEEPLKKIRDLPHGKALTWEELCAYTPEFIQYLEENEFHEALEALKKGGPIVFSIPQPKPKKDD